MFIAAPGALHPARAQSASPSAKTVLRVGFTEAVDNLNPFIGYTVSDYDLYHLNYDYLVGVDAATLKPRPELALSWSWTPDGKTWTFKLRPGVKWQDGVPFTAKDVAFTYNYIIKNDLSAFSSFTTNIKEAVAVDDLTVEMHLTKPKSNMLYLPIYIVPEHIWSKVSAKAATSTYTNPPPVVGTGPFQVTGYKPGREAVLQANKGYWGGAPKVDELVLSTYTTATGMAADLRSGILAAAVGLPSGVLDGLKSAPGIKAVAAQMKLIGCFSMNCYAGASSLGNPVLRDPAFRSALNWAIDREKISAIPYRGYAGPISTMILNSSPYHWEPPADLKYSFDLERANQALDAAGYKMGPNGIRLDKQGKPINLRFIVAAGGAEETVAKLITGWLQEIGLKITLSVMDTGSYLGKIYNTVGTRFAPDYDLELMTDATYVDPDAVLSWYTTSQVGGWSDTYWSNKEYDSLYEQQATAMDPAKRKQIVDKMQEIVYKDSPAIFLVGPKTLLAYNTSKWGGWVESPAGSGAVLWTMDNIDSYRLVHPKTATSTASNWTGLIAGIVVAVLVAVGIAWYLLRRRRVRAEEV
jgi:peptide/nickel transport system substrate-binding protein